METDVTDALAAILAPGPSGAPPLLLAPMAGYTDAAMRLVCGRRGAALCHTEMASGRGLLRGGGKTWILLETFEDEGPVSAHLYGSEPGVMAEAAALAGQTGRFTAVDLNAGCPVRKVTASGAGAALTRSPGLVHDILSAMARATPLPVTLKTRLGPSPDRVAVFELLDAAERAGARALTVHARFASRGHGGPPDWDLVAEVKQRARIPVIANGGIDSPAAARRARRETGCDALMIARGALGNPFLFQDIRRAWQTDGGEDGGLGGPDGGPGGGGAGEGPRRPPGEVRDALLRHLAAEKSLIARIRANYPMPETSATVDEALAAAFRHHLFRYLRGFRGSGSLRRNLAALRGEAAVLAAIDACFQTETAPRT